MSKSAKVTSIDVVGAFKLALLGFEEDARDALTSLVLEVRRAVDWIEHDRAVFWPRQVQRGWDEVNQARINLTRCKMQKVAGREPSCYEEKEALHLAKQRLRTAQEKVEAVRHWLRVVRHEADEFEGRLGRMHRWLDGDLPRALASLERMARALEKYTSLRDSASAPAANSEHVDS